MIFTIQVYIEDYLRNRGISDTDGFAVKLANLYFYDRGKFSKQEFLRKASRLKTIIYKHNQITANFLLNTLIDRLDKEYKKKVANDLPSFPGGLQKERRTLNKKKRRTITGIITEFCRAIAARAVDSFWVSREHGKLQKKPEKIAQSLLALFIIGVLQGSGIVFREFLSGIGFVDIGVVISKTLHLIELKVVSNSFSGVSQLNEYMKTEGRTKGSLIIFNASPKQENFQIPGQIQVEAGIIDVYVVNINPTPPSKMK